MRSWIGYVSPYVRSLELQVEKLETDRTNLINRIVRLTTGYSLEEPVPNVAEEVEQAVNVQLKQKEFLTGIDTRSPRPADVLARAEALSMEMDAKGQGVDLEAELKDLERNGISPEVRILQQGR